MKLITFFLSIALIFTACSLWADVKIEKIKYSDYGQCYSLSNGSVQVVVTVDVGPRIICYRLAGDTNIFAEMDPAVSKRNDKDFNILGGHRLWHAPERLGRNNLPDNKPVKTELVGNNAVRFTQETEKQSGIQKEMLVRLDETGTGVEVVHKLTNRGVWEIELAPWALTVVKPGGVALIPNEPFESQGDNLLPVRRMALWGYTDLSDKRWTFGSNFIRLRCLTITANAQKIGIENRQGWIGYMNDGKLFLKRFAYRPDKEYTDRDSNCELYTASNFMEIETLGYYQRLDTGQTASHTERWYIFDNVKGSASDFELNKTIPALLKQTKAVE